MRRLAALLCASLIAAACSEPPRKEIDRAQGALDAARAAGAEQYAPGAYVAATSALQQAHDAVDQRDYRLALSLAVDASERAQNAARAAADGKAAARSSSEAAIASAASTIEQLQARIKTAETARVAARDLQKVRSAAVGAAADLQEARTQVASGKFIEAAATVKGLRGEIEAQIRALDALIAAKTARPTRRRR